MKILIVILSCLSALSCFSQTRRSATAAPVNANAPITTTSSSDNKTKIKDEKVKSVSDETNAENKKDEIKKMSALSKALNTQTAKSSTKEEKSLEKTSQEKVSKNSDLDLTKNPIQEKLQASIVDSANIIIPNPEYKNVNAPVKKEIDMNNQRVDARNAKNMQLLGQLEYYQGLRKKWEENEKIRIEREEKEAAEKAKREADAYENRHLKAEDSPQFDKYRNGAKNPEVKKPDASEEYKRLFK